MIHFFPTTSTWSANYANFLIRALKTDTTCSSKTPVQDDTGDTFLRSTDNHLQRLWTMHYHNPEYYTKTFFLIYHCIHNIIVTSRGWKYLGTSFTNQNSIAEEIKSRLRRGNACYNSVQNFCLPRLLTKNLKTKIYRIIILPVVLYGCETWSFTLREERKLKVFENMVLRIFGPSRDKVTWEWRRLHN